MSPEQAHRRLDLDKTSDIYSLGAILYEILTGRRAYVSAEKDKEAARKETEELVKAGRFTPPIQVKPDVPAVLNAICLKAMAFKMSDRYQSAQELAADIEHWLADEPVSAYPEPWNARLARWERRHPKTVAGVAGALAVALVLAVLGAIVLGAEQRRTAAQKQIAEENFVVAREQLFGSIDLIETAEVDFATVPGLHARRRALLAAATRACRQALEKNPDDLEMRKRSALVYRYSANLHRLIEETANADKLYRDSLRLYEKLAEEEKETLDQRSRLAETLRDYASLQFKVGKLSAGTGNLERALKIVEAFPADEQKLPFRRLTRATILNDQAAFLYALGKDADSRRLLDEGTAILRELVALPAGKGHPYDPVLLAGALNRLAVSERDAGRLKEARKLHAESIQLLEDLLEKRPPRVVPSDILNFRALCWLEQARTLMKLGDAQARATAETDLGKAAEQWETLASSYAWVPLYRERWANALRARGQLRLEDKRLEPARADLEQALKILDELVKTNPTQPSYRANLGQTHAAIGRLERAASRPAESIKAFAEADRELEQAVKQSPDHHRHQQALKEVRAEKTK
jgi:serine/threonine-protein kinase